MNTTNQDRARAFFQRLAGEESATALVASLIAMLDEAESRGGAAGPNLLGDPVALELIKGTAREKLAAIQGRGGVMAFPPVALNDAAANIATAVAEALDAYQAPDEPTDLAPDAWFFCPACQAFAQWGTSGCAGPDEAMVGHCYGKEGAGCEGAFTWPRTDDAKYFRASREGGR